MSDAIRAMLDGMYSARCRNDVEAAAAYFAPAASFRIGGSKDLGTFTAAIVGADSLRSGFTGMFQAWDWSRFKVAIVAVDGETAVAHGSGIMRYVPRNLEVDTEILDLITVRDGKVVDFLEFVDTFVTARIMGGPGVAQ